MIIVTVISIAFTGLAKTQLVGTYTIGGTTPDYANISAAVADLVAVGIDGHVIFDIRDGVYNEQASISAFTGASADHTVTFRSESDDSTLVIWTFTPSSGANYTCRFNGCDYVRLEKITVQAVGASYATALRIQGGSCYNIISNCVLEGATTTSTSTNLGVIYEGSGTNTDNEFTDNIIRYGSYGIYYDGGTGIVIQDNQLSDQYYRALHLDMTDAVQVLRNNISGNTTNTSYEAVHMEYCDGAIEVLKNRIDVNYGYYGINLYYCYGTSGNRGLTANNFIHIGGATATGYGIYCYYDQYQNFYYNSVNVTRPGTNARCFYQSGSSGCSYLQLQNNMFVNQGNGYAIYISQTSCVNYSDYNNLYSTNLTGYWNGNCTTLADWQNASLKDPNSVSIAPEFVSNADLHVQAYLLDNLGYGVAEVGDDIDGEARHLTTPDMGADEWSTPATDAGVTSIDEDLTYCIDNDEVYVYITNFGGDVLTQVTIEWEVNSVAQTPYVWTGSLNQGDSEGPFSIGNFDFSLGTQYDVSAWTTLPNGSSEGFTHNDQSDVTDKYQAMSGIYTIGGTNPDYTNFNEAITDLVNGGVCEAVIFDVRDGVYNEQASIGAVAGVSADNTVTFRSESGDSTAVTWTFTPSSGANYTCQFNGCDHVHLEKMTMRAVGASYATVLRIQNSSQDNVISNCIIEGAPTTSSSTNLATIYEGSGTNINNIFSNNIILDGCYGIYYDGGTGIIIQDNHLSDQYYRALHLDMTDAVQVLRNNISSNTTNTSYEAVHMEYCDGAIEVLKNRIDVNYGYYGINLYYCYGTSGSRGLTANNFIHIGGATATGYGIYCYYDQYQNFYYNSVNVTRPGTNARCFYQGGSSGCSNLQLQNNMLVNHGSGYAIYISQTSGVNYSDYNNIYSANYTGYWNGNCVTLADWQDASLKDPNSVSIEPEFVSNADLHVQAYLLDNLGYGIAEVTDDIDSEERHLTTPDMGADEWTTPVADAGVTSIDEDLTFCIDNDSVYVTIKSYGTDNLTQVTIEWEVNSSAQTPYNWTGNLAQGESEGPFSIGYYDFSLGIQYDVSAWTTLPNGSTEGFTHNDQSDVLDKYQAMSGIYTIGGTDPDYANFNEAITDLVNGGVCEPVIFDIRDGQYNEQASIGEIAGVSDENTVTFRSESGDSTAVTWIFTPTSGDNYTCMFDGCDYVIFERITLRAVGAAYATALRIQNSSQHITIQNCILEGAATTTSSTNLAVIYEGSGNNHYHTYTNNLIINGCYGMYYDGGVGLVIESNEIRDQYYQSVHLDMNDGVHVLKNDISSNTDNTDYQALHMEYCDGNIQVLKNRINIETGYYGLYLYYCYGNSSDHGLIANNFIHVGGANNGHGVYCYYVQYQDFYYNSINMTRTYSLARPFSQTGSSGSTNIVLRNNMFVNQGGGYALYITQTSSINWSDYNNFFTTGASLGYWNGACSDLTAWQNASLKDPNSVSIDPEFVSNTDLHVQAYMLDNLGYGVAEVTDDIDDEERHLTTPDMGADEWTTPVADAGVTSINEDITFCIDNDSVYVIIKSYGTDNLSQVTIEWEVNSAAQIPFNWTGNLAQGESEGPFSIGYYDFNLAVQYDVRAWTSDPNGIPEGFNHNDTSEVLNKYQAMSGTYTIGGIDPDYANIGSAVTDLVNGGICSPVVFEIRDGLYNEQAAISSIAGVSEDNTVTFRSESGDSTLVVWTWTPTSGANYTCLLNSCDYVRIENITLRAVGAAYAIALKFQGGANNNIIRNCILEGGNTTSTSTNLAVIYVNSGTNSNNTITNNRIYDGSYGIYYYHGTGNIFEHNYISDQYYRSVHLYSTDGVRVEGNEISSNTSNSSYDAVRLEYCDGGIQILKNRISLGNGSYALYLYYCYGTSGNRGLIANNFIHVGGGGNGYGIGCYYAQYQNIYYNSVNVTLPGTGGRGLYQAGSSGSTNLQLQNNIFSNTGGGYAIYVTQTSSVNYTDYNDLYATGTNLGYWNGNQTTLAAWQGASLMDANSVSVDPEFVSDTDLHVCNPSLNGEGYPVAAVTDDIDGAPRANPFPDIGADEFDETISLEWPDDTTACGSIILDAGNPGASYTWSTGATGQSITVFASGEYWVTMSNACGTAGDTINVTILEEIVVDLGNDTTVCDVTELTLDAGNPGADFDWSTGESSQTITVTADGTYWVEVTDANCSGGDTIIVNFGTSPSSSFTAESPVCEGDTATIEYTGSAGAGAAYSWDFDGGTIISGTGQGPYEISWIAGGTKIVSLTVTEDGCTSDETTSQVIVNTLPTSTFTAESPLCPGDTSEITYTGSADAGASYTWGFDGGVILSGSGQGPYMVIWDTEGDKTISLTVEEGGCTSATTENTVTVNPAPDVPVIDQAGNVLMSSSSTGNQWYLNGVPVDGATSQFYTAQESGFYQVEVTNIYGCTAISDPLNVIITGIADNEYQDQVKIYPNPANRLLYLDMQGVSTENMTVGIFDMVGRVLYIKEYTNVRAGDIYPFDISEYVEGIYLINVILEENTISEVIIKSN